MRRPVTDTTLLTTALAGRVDTVEGALAGVGQDVTALGRGLAALTAQIRDLTTTRTTGPSPTAAAAAGRRDSDGGAGQGDDGGTAAGPVGGVGGGEPSEGQRDWLAVTDPDQAGQWLDEAAAWAVQVLTQHGLTLAGVPCWPLHPDVVADLLALIAQREDAYTTPNPAGVSEWLTRWLPAGLDRIRAALAACAADRGHHHDGHLHDATALTPAAAARWWTTSDQPAPAALDLPLI